MGKWDGLSAREVAEFFEVTPQAVGLWAKKEGCPRSEDQTYDLKAVAKWYVDRLKTAVPLGEDSPNVERKRAAEAEMAEIKLAAMKADLVPVEQVEQRNVAKIQALTRGLELMAEQMPPILANRPAREIKGELKDAVLKLRKGFARGG